MAPVGYNAWLLYSAQTFSGRGWLSRIFFAKSDVETLQEVDAGLTQCLGDMVASMQAGIMAVQVNMYEEAAKANAEVLTQIKELGNKVRRLRVFPAVDVVGVEGFGCDARVSPATPCCWSALRSS